MENHKFTLKGTRREIGAIGKKGKFSCVVEAKDSEQAKDKARKLQHYRGYEHINITEISVLLEEQGEL